MNVREKPVQTKFSNLPSDIKKIISNLLLPQDFRNFISSSREYYNFFTTSNKLIPLLITQKILPLVVRGHYEAAVKIFSKNPDLMYQKGEVTDLSHRTFTNISGFEYAIWALDEHMWKTMLACLPKNEAGEKIKAELRVQYQKVKTEGVTYTLNGVTEHYMPEAVTKTETHFDFENTIIKELENFVDNNDRQEWIHRVGGTQRLMPMHVVFAYCNKRPFFEVEFNSELTFSQQPKILKHFYNSFEKKDESWFAPNSKLGIDFAIFKAFSIHFYGTGVGSTEQTVIKRGDLLAIKALYEERRKNCNKLEDELKPNTNHQIKLQNWN